MANSCCFERLCPDCMERYERFLREYIAQGINQTMIFPPKEMLDKYPKMGKVFMELISYVKTELFSVARGSDDVQMLSVR